MVRIVHKSKADFLIKIHSFCTISTKKKKKDSNILHKYRTVVQTLEFGKVIYYYFVRLKFPTKIMLLGR